MMIFQKNERTRADQQNFASDFFDFAAKLSCDISKFKDNFTTF